MSWLFQPLLPASAEIESGPVVGVISPAYWVGGSGNWTATDPTNWASTSGGTGGAGYPDSTSDVIFDSNSNVGTGSFTVTADAGACNNITISGLDGAMTLAPTTGGLTVYGTTELPVTNLTISGSAAITFAATSSKNITSNGVTFDCPVTYNGVGGTWVLQDNLTVGTTRTTTLTNGTLNLNNNTLSTGIFVSTSGSARTIAFGTGGITLTATTTTTICNTSVSSNLTVTGTPVITTTGGGSTTKTINNAVSSISFSVNNTAGTVTFTSGNSVMDLSIANNSITVSGGSLNIYGNLSLAGTSPTLSIAPTFLAATGTKTIDLKGKYVGGNATFNSASATWQLLSNAQFLTTTLTAGSLNLNSYTITAYSFISSNSNTRSLIGPGTFTISTDAAFAWSTVTATNLTVSGDIQVNVSVAFVDSGTTVATGAVSEANTIDFTINGGGLGVSLANSSRFRNLTLVNTPIVIDSGSNIQVFGNLTFSGTSTLNNLGTITLAATSGTKTITSNGLTVNTPLIVNGVGGTYQLADNLTIFSGRSFTLTNGTIDLNAKTLNPGSALTTATGTKNITFNGGTILCSAAGTVFNNAVPTGLTTTAGTGTGRIDMSSASAKTFVGGGSTFNCILRNTGLGTLTINGNGTTFSSIQNTVQPTTIRFQAGSTFNFLNGFELSGTSGNLVTIDSSTAGSQATLSLPSGTVSVSFCSIKDSNATGGASWQAYTINGNTDGGNNAGWLFVPVPVFLILDANIVLSGGILITF